MVLVLAELCKQTLVLVDAGLESGHELRVLAAAFDVGFDGGTDDLGDSELIDTSNGVERVGLVSWEADGGHFVAHEVLPEGMVRIPPIVRDQVANTQLVTLLIQIW